MVTDCLFCKIAARELDADIVAESEEVVAFRDIDPKAPTHILVIPRRHIASAREVTSAESGLLGEMFELTNKLADDDGLDAGYRVLTNVGRGAGQSVAHFHLHLLGGRDMGWPPG